MEQPAGKADVGPMGTEAQVMKKLADRANLNKGEFRAVELIRFATALTKAVELQASKGGYSVTKTAPFDDMTSPEIAGLETGFVDRGFAFSARTKTISRTERHLTLITVSWG